MLRFFKEQLAYNFLFLLCPKYITFKNFIKIFKSYHLEAWEMDPILRTEHYEMQYITS